MTERKSPLEQVFDLFVYAPLGLALTARDELPRLIERGKKQLQEQATLARMMGEYAVGEAQKEAEKAVRQASETLSGLTGRREAAPAGPALQISAAPAPAPAPAPAKPAGPRPTDDALAIHGYDALSASQVVQRLGGLAPEELEAVRTYEEATRGRRTILSRVAQLQAGATPA